MKNTIVSVNRLWKGKDKFTYSKYAEALAAHWLAKDKQWIIEEYTTGFDARYDARLSGKRVEIKFQTSENLAIEYARPDYTPSGLFASESDYYLLINPGWSKKRGEWVQVGKVRLIKTSDLKQSVLKQIESGNAKLYPTNEDGPGSRVVYLDPKTDLLNDGWLGDIGCVKDEDGTLFNFGQTEIVWFNATLAAIYEELTTA